MKLVIGLLFGTAFEFYDFAGACVGLGPFCCNRYHAVLLAEADVKPPCCNTACITCRAYTLRQLVKHRLLCQLSIKP
jgi:hypothetical protein